MKACDICERTDPSGYTARVPRRMIPEICPTCGQETRTTDDHVFDLCIWCSNRLTASLRRPEILPEAREKMPPLDVSTTKISRENALARLRARIEAEP